MQLLVWLWAWAFAQSAWSLTFKSEEIDANFDSITISQPTSLDFYGQLHWSGFMVEQENAVGDDGEFTGVEVKSEPHFARGQVDLFGGLPRITTTYPGSNVAFFDLKKFWWGCSTTSDPETPPTWCTLEVNGYTREGKKPIAQAVSFFVPEDEARSMAMVECHLPSTFNGINRVEFNVIASSPILYLDNVVFKVYNVTDLGRGLGEVIHSSETSQSEFVLQVRGLQKIG